MDVGGGSGDTGHLFNDAKYGDAISKLDVKIHMKTRERNKREERALQFHSKIINRASQVKTKSYEHEVKVLRQSLQDICAKTPYLDNFYRSALKKKHKMRKKTKDTEVLDTKEDIDLEKTIDSTLNEQVIQQSATAPEIMVLQSGSSQEVMKSQYDAPPEVGASQTDTPQDVVTLLPPIHSPQDQVVRSKSDVSKDIMPSENEQSRPVVTSQSLPSLRGNNYNRDQDTDAEFVKKSHRDLNKYSSNVVKHLSPESSQAASLLFLPPVHQTEKKSDNRANKMSSFGVSAKTRRHTVALSSQCDALSDPGGSDMTDYFTNKELDKIRIRNSTRNYIRKSNQISKSLGNMYKRRNDIANTVSQNNTNKLLASQGPIIGHGYILQTYKPLAPIVDQDKGCNEDGGELISDSVHVELGGDVNDLLESDTAPIIM